MRALAHPSRSGFTLVEILVALGIFVVGMGSIVGLLMAATWSHRQAQIETDVTLLVDSLVSEIESSPRFVIKQPLANIQKRESRQYPGFSYNVRFEALDSVGFEVLSLIEVEWTERGEKRSRVFRTILLRKFPY